MKPYQVNLEIFQLNLKKVYSDMGPCKQNRAFILVLVQLQNLIVSYNKQSATTAQYYQFERPPTNGSVHLSLRLPSVFIHVLVLTVISSSQLELLSGSCCIISSWWLIIFSACLSFMITSGTLTCCVTVDEWRLTFRNVLSVLYVSTWKIL